MHFDWCGLELLLLDGGYAGGSFVFYVMFWVGELSYGGGVGVSIALQICCGWQSFSLCLFLADTAVYDDILGCL